MQPPSSDRAGATAATAAAVGRARILLVDDDGIILRATVSALRHHDVIATTSANEAIDRVTRGERFDAVFCDAVMPERSGLDVFAAVTAEDPELAGRFVLLTGGLDERLAAGAAERGLPVLEKPFDLDDLEKLIEDLPRR